VAIRTLCAPGDTRLVKAQLGHPEAPRFHQRGEGSRGVQ
jgi:hypothetical protein